LHQSTHTHMKYKRILLKLREALMAPHNTELTKKDFEYADEIKQIQQRRNCHCNRWGNIFRE
jgi:hypothetical protein